MKSPASLATKKQNSTLGPRGVALYKYIQATVYAAASKQCENGENDFTLKQDLDFLKRLAKRIEIVREAGGSSVFSIAKSLFPPSYKVGSKCNGDEVAGHSTQSGFSRMTSI